MNLPLPWCWRFGISGRDGVRVITAMSASPGRDAVLTCWAAAACESLSLSAIRCSSASFISSASGMAARICSGRRRSQRARSKSKRRADPSAAGGSLASTFISSRASEGLWSPNGCLASWRSCVTLDVAEGVKRCRRPLRDAGGEFLWKRCEDVVSFGGGAG